MSSRTSRFPTRVLLSAAALGAAGAVYISLISFASVFTGAIAYYAYAATISLWTLPVLVSQVLLRRPGVALLTALLMGVISAPFIGGSVTHIANFVIAGILFELPFLLTRYRRWTRATFWTVHPISAALYTALYAVTVFLVYDVPVWWMFALLVVGGVASCLAVTALGQLIGGRLRAAGLGGRDPGPAPDATTDTAPDAMTDTAPDSAPVAHG